MREIIENIKKSLLEAVKRNPYKGLLFSGGLDTSILASLNPKAIAITISLGSQAEDIRYSRSLASLLNMKHHHKVVDIDGAIQAIPEVIKILKSFDPAIPNDLPVYFGLKEAVELGINSIGTGDGSDELFGGYSFMEDMDNLERYIHKISEKLSFNSNDIGMFLKMKVIQPFIDKSLVDLALKIPADLKIRRENDKVFGKWILRKSFEDVLPKEIVWQSKRPLEYGSGFNRLRQIISDKVCDEEFRESAYPVKVMSKEHLYYYKIYKKVVGKIPKPKSNEKSCPGCGAGISKDGFHCKTCGYVLDWRV
jgi:asparagine synthase (glutamine-hydrolysing)